MVYYGSRRIGSVNTSSTTTRPGRRSFSDQGSKDVSRVRDNDTGSRQRNSDVNKNGSSKDVRSRYEQILICQATLVHKVAEMRLARM